MLQVAPTAALGPRPPHPRPQILVSYALPPHPRRRLPIRAAAQDPCLVGLPQIARRLAPRLELKVVLSNDSCLLGSSPCLDASAPVQLALSEWALRGGFV